MSLKYYYREAYGSEVEKMACAYGKCLLKLSRFKNHVVFSARCKRVGFLPHSLRIRSPVPSRAGWQIARKAGYKFLNERLRMANRKIEELEDEKKWTEIGLRRNLSESDYDRLIETSCTAAERAFVKTRDRQKKKFERQFTRTEQRDRRQAVDKSRWVVNLSKRQLVEEERKVLEWGMKFAPSPRTIPKAEIIALVEDAVQTNVNVKPAEADLVRAAVAGAVRKAKPPKSNVRKSEWEAMSRLREDKSIVILEADKGNATVVMDADEYERKALDLIGKQPFKQLCRDPTRNNDKRVNDVLKRLNKEGRLSKKTLAALKSQVGESRSPLFYGKVKLHKEGAPLRPIVSSVGSCTYKVAKGIAKILAPYSQQVESCIRNTKDLMEEILTWKVEPDEVLVSFDVKSLYTSVPVDDALRVVEKSLGLDASLEDRCGYTKETVMDMLKVCLEISHFRFRNNHYCMEDGLAMGSPVSPPVANLFMAEFEKEAIESFENEKPRKWNRYVDDVISIMKRSLVGDLLKHLNSRHKNINFTVEVEEEGRLPMLDLVLHRMEDGTITTTVFRKPTHTERYLPFLSHHPPSMKRSVVKSLAHRVNYVSPELRLEKEREVKHVMDVLIENGYPRACLERWMKTGKGSDLIAKEDKLNTSVCLPYVGGLSEQIRRILRKVGIGVAFKPNSWKWKIMDGVKDKEEEGQRAGVVYEIKCGDCEKCYIGETGRNADIRVKEHRAHARNGHPELSAVAEHALEGHRVEWSPKILALATKTRVRRVKEALFIHERDKKGKVTMNRDKGVELSAMWLDLF